MRLLLLFLVRVALPISGIDIMPYIVQAKNLQSWTYDENTTEIVASIQESIQDMQYLIIGCNNRTKGEPGCISLQVYRVSLPATRIKWPSIKKPQKDILKATEFRFNMFKNFPELRNTMPVIQVWRCCKVDSANAKELVPGPTDRLPIEGLYDITNANATVEGGHRIRLQYNASEGIRYNTKSQLFRVYALPTFVTVTFNATGLAEKFLVREKKDLMLTFTMLPNYVRLETEVPANLIIDFLKPDKASISKFVISTIVKAKEEEVEIEVAKTPEPKLPEVDINSDIRNIVIASGIMVAVSALAIAMAVFFQKRIAKIRAKNNPEVYYGDYGEDYYGDYGNYDYNYGNYDYNYGNYDYKYGGQPGTARYEEPYGGTYAQPGPTMPASKR